MAGYEKRVELAGDTEIRSVLLVGGPFSGVKYDVSVSPNTTPPAELSISFESMRHLWDDLPIYRTHVIGKNDPSRMFAHYEKRRLCFRDATEEEVYIYSHVEVAD